MDKLTIEIDFKKITENILESETYSNGNDFRYTVQEKVEQEIKDEIQRSVSDEIRTQLDLSSFIDNKYTNKYITKEAEKICDKAMRELVQEHAKKWIKSNMRYVVERVAQDEINDFFIPRLQSCISNLLVVNTDTLEQEMQEMKDDYEAQIRELEENV